MYLPYEPQKEVKEEVNLFEDDVGRFDSLKLVKR